MGAMGKYQIMYQNIAHIEMFHGGRRNALMILKSIRDSVICDPDFTRYGKILRVSHYVLSLNQFNKKGSTH